MEVKIKDNDILKDADWTIEDGVMVVSPKEMKIDVTQFNDGDVITCGHDAFHWTCILRGEIEYIIDNMFIGYYCCINSDGTYNLEPTGSDSAIWVRYATEEEKQKLFDKLADEGLAWDADKKEIVKLKWKPKLGDDYWRADYKNFKFISAEWTWKNSIYEIESFDKGMVFKTDEECQEFCDKLNQVINQVKP